MVTVSKVRNPGDPGYKNVPTKKKTIVIKTSKPIVTKKVSSMPHSSGKKKRLQSKGVKEVIKGTSIPVTKSISGSQNTITGTTTITGVTKATVGGKDIPIQITQKQTKISVAGSSPQAQLISQPATMQAAKPNVTEGFNSQVELGMGAAVLAEERGRLKYEENKIKGLETTYLKTQDPQDYKKYSSGVDAYNQSVLGYETKRQAFTQKASLFNQSVRTKRYKEMVTKLTLEQGTPAATGVVVDELGKTPFERFTNPLQLIGSFQWAGGQVMRMGAAAGTAVSGNYPKQWGLSPSIQQTQSTTVKPLTQSPGQFLTDYNIHKEKYNITEKNPQGTMTAFTERNVITPKSTMEANLLSAEIAGNIAGSIALGAGLAAYNEIKITDVKYVQKIKPYKPTSKTENVLVPRNDGGVNTVKTTVTKSGHMRTGEYEISTRRLLQPKPDVYTFQRGDFGFNSVKSGSAELSPGINQVRSEANTAFGKSTTKGVKLGVDNTPAAIGEGGTFKTTDLAGNTQKGVYIDKITNINTKSITSQFSARGVKGLEYIRTEGTNINYAANIKGGSSGAGGTSTLTKTTTLTDTAALNLVNPPPITTPASTAITSLSATSSVAPAITKSAGLNTRLVTTTTDTKSINPPKTATQTVATTSLKGITTSDSATASLRTVATPQTTTMTTLKTVNALKPVSRVNSGTATTTTTTLKTDTSLKLDTGLKPIQALQTATTLKTPQTTNTQNLNIVNPIGGTTSITTIPFIPVITMPSLGGMSGGGGTGGGSSLTRRKGKQKKTYTPSVAAWFTGATSNIIPKGLFTGAEIRPIITKKKKRRKRG